MRWTRASNSNSGGARPVTGYLDHSSAVAAKQANISQLLLVTFVFIGLVIWIGGAYSNGDLLWFYPVFNESPSYIIIYRYGKTVEVTTEQPGFDALVKAANAEIPRHVGYQEGLRPANETLEFYQTKGYAIELVYPQPVLIHTRYYFPAARRLFIAIDGSYNYTDLLFLFRGSAQQWLPGGIALVSVDQVRAAADSIIAASQR